MLQNAAFTTFTVVELLKENQKKHVKNKLPFQ